MDFNGNQTVQGPKDSFSANCSKGFKQFQTMNKVLQHMQFSESLLNPCSWYWHVWLEPPIY